MGIQSLWRVSPPSPRLRRDNFREAKVGAGRGNRTLVFCLEGSGSTIELCPRPCGRNVAFCRMLVRLRPSGSGATPLFTLRVKSGGRGWIRTSVRSRGQIYSLLPLTTRPPFRPCFPKTGGRLLAGNPLDRYRNSPAQSPAHRSSRFRGARLIVRSPPPLKLRTPRRQFEEETGGPSWIWGVHASLAALANPARQIERVVASRNAAARLPQGIEAQILDPDAIDGMLPPGAVHQGLAVRASPLEPLSVEAACLPADTRPVLILDGVTDPQNVGAAFRSAAAFGARALVLQDR